MRVLFILALLVPPLPADLIARITTDRGSIDVVLLADVAPQAVANFITLSQGTRARVDPVTGALTDQPLYVGEKFFRVINQDSFRIAQTGSGAPANSGDPGFTFRDEFDPAVRHEPYVLSMANSGPNTNGSQIFFTGNLAIPHLDDIHTIFGRIPGADGRATIDAILAAGDNGSTIEAIEILRTDAAAEAFDEFAQGLASVQATAGSLRVTQNGPVSWRFPSPPAVGTQLSVFRSPDLMDWSGRDNAIVAYDNPDTTSLTIDSGTSPSAFFRLAEVSYPDSPTPSSLAGRRLEFEAPGASASVVMDFDDSGEGGSYTYNGEPGTITGVDFNPTGYGGQLVVQTSDLIPLRLVLGIDAEEETRMTGRLNLSGFSEGSWQSFGSGTFSLSR